MTDYAREPGMIANVSLRLLYLIFDKMLGLILLLGRRSSTKDVELLVLRHEVLPATLHGVDSAPTPAELLRSSAECSTSCRARCSSTRHDPVAIARLETPAASPLQRVARELDSGTTVPEASWVAVKASESAAVNEPPSARRFLPLAEILAAAGWNHPQPLTLPVSSRNPGTLVRFLNITGLVAGETARGEELNLLHGPLDIARSALAPLVDRIWDGTTFALHA